MVRIFITLASILLLFSSCKTTHDLSYFEDIKMNESGIINASDYAIKIQPEDELSIIITSLEPTATDMFNPGGPLPPTERAPYRVEQYRVDREGNINLPTIGKFHVEGLTTAEVKNKIEKKVLKSVKDPYVNVQLSNFKVRVLGEVRSPQTINVNTERFSLLDALASCGDLTDYAERENIMVLRTLPDGKVEYHKLNLRDSKLVESPYFYLQQNDVVYAYPNKVKQDNSKYNQNNGYKLSVISSIVSASSVIASLLIAILTK